jgi:hypothetical protein
MDCFVASAPRNDVDGQESAFPPRDARSHAGGPIMPRPQNIENNPMQSSVNMPEGYLFSEKQKK